MSEITLKFSFLGLVFLSVFFEVLADVLFKQWVLANRNALFALGMIVYLVGTFLWAISLKFEYFSKAGAVFTLLNLVALTLIGLLFYKEDLSLINRIGIITAAISIILIEV